MATRVDRAVAKRIVTHGAVFVTFLILAGVLAVVVERDVASTRESDDNVPALLFAMDARASQIVESPVDLDEELLVLYGVDPAAVWFTDRPDRQSGLMSVIDLMSDWESFGFYQDPPNAAVAFSDGGRAAVELTYPRYDPGSAIWMATVDFLPGSPSSLVRNVDLGEVNLFIDDVDWTIPPLISGVSDNPGSSSSGLPDVTAIAPTTTDIFSVPTSTLVSIFSNYHLDYAKEGVALYAQTVVGENDQREAGN